MRVELESTHPYTGGGLNPLRLWAVVRDKWGNKIAEVEVEIVDGVVRLIESTREEKE